MKHTTIFVAAGLSLAFALSIAPAKAGAARTFVSPTGSDSNLCTLVAPCRFLQAALAQTNPGGEIAVLGTAGYNNGQTVTIDKAISIVNPGAFEAGIIVPSGGLGIYINAGPNDAVSLRGLTIEGGGVGTTGVIFDGGKSLSIANSVVHGLAEYGIRLNTPGARVNVSNSIISDNLNVGLLITASLNGMRITVNRTEIFGNAVGIDASGLFLNLHAVLWMSVNDSIISGSGQYGIQAENGSQGFVTIAVTRSSIVDGAGAAILSSGAGTVVELNQSTVMNNSSGWSTANGGAMLSWGNNAFINFGSVGDGAIQLRNPI